VQLLLEDSAAVREAERHSIAEQKHYIMSTALLLAAAGNIGSAVHLILTNKRVIIVDKFAFTAVLAVLHSYTTFLGCLVLLLAGFIKYKPVSSMRTLTIISIGSLVSILFMNLSLVHNSVGFYQISKLACIPMTLLIECYLGMMHQTLTLRLLLSLLLLSVGMALVATNDTSATSLGLLWAFLGTFSTSVAQVLFSPLQKSLQLDPLQLLLHTSPMLTLGASLAVPLSDDMPRLLSHRVTTELVRDLAISCVCAIVLNMTNYAVLSMTTPLTNQIIGHVKTIAIIVFGVIYTDNKPTTKMILGICLALLGVGFYTREKQRQNSG
jgi:solute carrier family 35 protein E3